MLIIDFENYIINYAILFDSIIDYDISIINYIDNPQVLVLYITNNVNKIIDYWYRKRGAESN